MNRPHYAWLVCLGGALTLLSTVGLGVNVFAVYQPEIIALRHFTNCLLQDRIRMLSTMVREARELAVLTERYYDRGYRRNVRYTV